ncbi:MBL fold metallo-hydrolase [Paenibacillus sp. FSL H8-0079]|uniref:MBL fold metallo-hydrolase n=1 Tax=Paenibacillus sp. FSL H8-0079 TaxID=2921375 RepID=UPI0030EEDB36
MSNLSIEVFTGSSQAFNVNSAIVYGEKDAVLVDAQFLLSDAHRLTARLLELGKNLTHIYVTHFHPDHYFGLQVVKSVYPQAQVLALAETVEDIKNTFAKKIAQWKPTVGNNVPDVPVIPDVLDQDIIELEGHELKIKGRLQGDTPNNSYVWIPSIKALITGDIVYNDTFVWTLETNTESRQAWHQTLDELQSLNPEIVVAGHQAYNTENTPEAIAHTRRYLVAFDEVLSESPTTDQIIAKVKSRFPELNTVEIGLILAAKAFGVNHAE